MFKLDDVADYLSNINIEQDKDDIMESWKHMLLEGYSEAQLDKILKTTSTEYWESGKLIWRKDHAN